MSDAVVLNVYHFAIVRGVEVDVADDVLLEAWGRTDFVVLVLDSQHLLNSPLPYLFVLVPCNKQLCK